MSIPFVTINTWDDIPPAIARMQVAGAGHRVPLLQALYHSHIAYADMHRGTSSGYFKRFAAAVCLPAVVVLGDDDHATPDGPSTWPIASRVLRWAEYVMIHGGAGRPEHYEQAITLARIFRRLAMVECSSANVEAWQAAALRWAPRAPRLTMQPLAGCLHPSLDRSTAQ